MLKGLARSVRRTLWCTVVAWSLFGYGGAPQAGQDTVDTANTSRDVNNVLVIDTDESRTSPVPHRFIHGAFGDANFVIRLPDNWNGKLLVACKGGRGDEFQSDPLFGNPGLTKGYAYAASDEGWTLATIGANAKDELDESRRRIKQLTDFVHGVIAGHYGSQASRTYLVGFSNGGHRVKWLVESYPERYDGGLAGAGYNSHLEIFFRWAQWRRAVDVIAPRMSAIIAARNANPNWDHNSTPLNPPLTTTQLQALNEIYALDVEMRHGFHYDLGTPKGTEANWLAASAAAVALVVDALPSMDPDYDPDGDGSVSTAEATAWDPHTRPRAVQNKLSKADVNGALGRPMIIYHGLRDALVPPGESLGYKGLVESTLGVAGSNEVLRVYMVPGIAHNAPALTPFANAAIDALDRWVDHIESGGQTGEVPTTVNGISPL